MKIFYRYKDTIRGEWEEIDDLYFFKEKSIHSFSCEDWGDDMYNMYEYKFVVQNGDNINAEIMVKIDLKEEE